jgi:hypothetical protein
MMQRRSSCGGFTLVELMVSITGGLFVSIAVFMLAKQSTNLYQSEGRAGNATLGSIVGFERLRQDVERAAFLSTPMIRRDPKVCGDPIGSSDWPDYLKHLQGVMINPANPATVPNVLTKNNSKPDEITLAGSYVSDERFFADTISSAGGADTITLESDKGGLAKLGYIGLASNPSAQTALLASVFGVGRGLRIVDKSNGKESYGTIASVQGGSPPTIVLRSGAGGPSLIYRSGSALRCGIAGTSRSSVVNVVNIVHYALRDMSLRPNYQPLFDNSGYGPTQESLKRAELVREELDTTGAPIAGTEEIVTEFAVDLKFGVTVGHVISGTSQVSKLETLLPGDVNVAAWAGDTTTVTGQAAAMPPSSPPAPQLVRAVRIRLGVRSRDADRSTNLDGGVGMPMAPGLYRIGTDPAGGGPFARVRTMQADVALRNQQGATFL